MMNAIPKCCDIIVKADGNKDNAQNGIKLFGTNPDKFTIVGKYKVPGAGSIIAAI